LQLHEETLNKTINARCRLSNIEWPNLNIRLITLNRL